jgi:hypothetical protein
MVEGATIDEQRALRQSAMSAEGNPSPGRSEKIENKQVAMYEGDWDEDDE